MRKTLLAVTASLALLCGLTPALAMPAGEAGALGADHARVINVRWGCGWYNEWCRPRVGVGVAAPGVGVWVGGHPHRYYRHWHHRHYWHHWHHWHHYHHHHW